MSVSVVSCDRRYKADAYLITLRKVSGLERYKLRETARCHTETRCNPRLVTRASVTGQVPRVAYDIHARLRRLLPACHKLRMHWVSKSKISLVLSVIVRRV
jgi:hypothetical protein